MNTPHLGLLLVDHGSKRSEANSRLDEIAQLLRKHQEERGVNFAIAVAHMELAAPDILTSLQALAARGVREVRVIPLMISRGKHVQRDIPRLLREAKAALPELQLLYAPPLSEHALFLDLLLQSASSETQAIELV